jgi:hypothetical protein
MPKTAEGTEHSCAVRAARSFQYGTPFLKTHKPALLRVRELMVFAPPVPQFVVVRVKNEFC